VNWKRLVPYVLATLIVALLLGACGDDGNDEATASTRRGPHGIEGSFFGKVEQTDAFIALATLGNEGNTAMVYVCDSQGISQWFQGPVGKDALDLTAPNGARLQAKLSLTEATGSVTLADGRSLEFKAVPYEANSGAGLFRARETIGGSEYLAGWILLPGDQQRGSIQSGATQSAAPPLNIREPVVSAGGSELRAMAVQSFYLWCML
jgi:hypothetical protein